MNDWFEAGHVAIVTGSSRGLGRAIARELAQARVRLVIDGRDPLALEAVREELAGRTDVVAIAGDVADPAHVHALVSAARKFGRLDLLVNNASTLGAVPLPRIDELDAEAFDRLFAVNVFAPIHLIQHALPLMARSAVATVVNVSSDAAVEAYAGWGGYGASKAALDHVSRVLAVELEGSAVRVLAVDPGDMNTEMHRAAIPDADVAALADPADSARALLAAVAAMREPFERVRLAATVAA